MFIVAHSVEKKKNIYQYRSRSCHLTIFSRHDGGKSFSRLVDVKEKGARRSYRVNLFERHGEKKRFDDEELCVRILYFVFCLVFKLCMALLEGKLDAE